MKRITQTVAVLLMASTLPACRLNQPIRTVFTGMMDMRGDMDVNGGMEMSGQVATVMKADNTGSRLASVPVYAGPHTAGQAKIAVVDVDGLLVNKPIGGFGAMGENPTALFREKLDALSTDPSVRAIVLRINSPGGGVTATDIMTRDLQQIKSQLNIPVVACIMDVGAGGGYYLATAADRVIAHPTSIVGGVGVIFNIYNLEDNLGQFGVISIPVKSGEKIDIASPERVMEADERAMLQEIADSFHERFKSHVLHERIAAPVHGVAPADRDKLAQAFDGRVLTGEQAVAIGMIDSTGYLDDAIAAARQLAALPADAPIVMLRRDNDRAYTLLDVTPLQSSMPSLLPLKLPGLDRAALPTFMYLWQPEPTLVSTF